MVVWGTLCLRFLTHWQVEVMRKLQHENVVQLKEVIDDKSSNSLCMVQEYAVHGPIMTEAEYNKPLDANLARAYFR